MCNASESLQSIGRVAWPLDYWETGWLAGDTDVITCKEMGEQNLYSSDAGDPEAAFFGGSFWVGNKTTR
jgi:hypothetical protein